MRPPQRLGSPYINQRNFLFALVGITLVFIVVFFAYEFKFVRSPRLEVLFPDRDINSKTEILTVRGRIDPDADLTLNARPLYSGEAGEFTERVYLAKGLNTLDFVAKNRYGRTTKITRYVVAN